MPGTGIVCQTHVALNGDSPLQEVAAVYCSLGCDAVQSSGNSQMVMQDSLSLSSSLAGIFSRFVAVPFFAILSAPHFSSALSLLAKPIKIRIFLLCQPFSLSRKVKCKICKTKTLSVVLYRYEYSSRTFRKYVNLRVFENRVLKGGSGHKWALKNHLLRTGHEDPEGSRGVALLYL